MRLYWSPSLHRIFDLHRGGRNRFSKHYEFEKRDVVEQTNTLSHSARMAVRFTFRQLEYFIAVGKAGSIVAASEEINISSPSISAAISQLEKEFDIQLFVRQHARGLSLTPGGRQFYNQAKRLLAEADSLHDIANDIAETVRGPITVGCLVTISPSILPEFRSEFERLFPNVDFRQVEANQAGLLNKLHRAEIDVALTYDLEIPNDIAFEPLKTMPPYALFAPDHPFASKPFVTAEMLETEPLVLLDLPMSTEYFLSLFLTRNLRPNVVERTPHIMTLRSMVANGLGYGILNIPSLNEHAPDGKPLRYVPLKGEMRPMVLGLARMQTEFKSAVLSAFEEHCRDMTARIPPAIALS